MKLLILTALLFAAGPAFAGAYHVHYSLRASDRDITVQAGSSRIFLLIRAMLGKTLRGEPEELSRAKLQNGWLLLREEVI